MQNFIAQSIRKAMGVKDPEHHEVSTPADLTQESGSPLAHMYNNRWNKSTLEYPYDIQQRSDLCQDTRREYILTNTSTQG